MIIQQLLYFIFVHISLFIPGYVLVRKSKLRSSPGIELGMAYAVMLGIYMVLSSATYILKIPEVLPQMFFWILLLGSLYLFISQKLYVNLRGYIFPLAALVAMSAFSLAFIGMSFANAYKIIPDPEYRAGKNYQSFNVKVLNVAQTPANDNYIPYRQAQFFINRSNPASDSFIDEWGVHFFQRTPLMGAVTAQYFTALNDALPIGYSWNADSPDPDQTYIKFHIIAQILNSLFILPAIYLLGRFFGRRAAMLSAFFIIPSQFFLYNSFFTWPKSLVAFFILLSWLLILEKRFRYLLLAGVVSGLAYLSHDLAVLYIAASFVLLLYQKRFKHAAIFSVVAALFALPWLILSSVIYKKPSSFFLYPLSTKGIPQPAERAKILQEFWQTSPLRLIAIRLESLFYLISPYQLIYSEGGQEIGRRVWAFGLFSIPGSLGAGMIIPAVLGLIKKLKDLTLWILLIVPLATTLVISGWPKAFGSLHFAEVTVVLLIGLGCYWLAKRKSIVWTLLAYILNSAQLVFLLIYSFPGSISTWSNAPGDIVRISFLSLIIVSCGIGAYLVQKDSPLIKKLSFDL